MKMTGKFSNADAYDRNTGRFSRLLAGRFIDFVGVKDGERLLDVGCGTGSLAFTAAALMRRSEIVGIDRSASFIEHARSRASDPRLTFNIGDALSLPYPNESFEKCLSMLVIQFIPDIRRAIAEMLRVTRQEGTVAACAWDKNDDELHCVFWDTAAELDPEAEQLRDARGYVGGQLSTLWVEGGFTNVEEAVFTISPEFESFDAFWTPLAEGQGLSSTYLARLTADKQLDLRERVRGKVLGTGPNRPFRLQAKARVVRGVP